MNVSGPIFPGYDFSFFSVIFLTCALITLFNGILTFKIRRCGYFLYLSLLSFATSQWSFALIFETAGTIVSQKYFWSQLSYIGTVVVPVFFALFSIEYGIFRSYFKKRTFLLFFLIPLFILILTFTNSIHNLIWTDITINPGNGLAFYAHGSIFWIFLVYCYFMFFTGMVIHILSIIRLHRTFGIKTLLFSFASILPMVGNIMYVFNINPVPALDWTPIFLTVCSIMFTSLCSGHSFSSILPINRNTLVDMIHNGVIFINNDNRILDINISASKIFNKSLVDCFGKPITSLHKVFTKFEYLVFDDSNYSSFKFQLGKGKDHKHFDIRVSLLFDNNKNRGKLIMLSDITSSLHLNEDLEEKVKSDPLTGAFNRYYLDLLNETNLDELGNFGLIMLDIDHFKRINDTYGHRAGDEVLSKLVTSLKNEIRDDDSIIRYGGEEFIIILRNINHSVFFNRADHFRTITEKLEFQFPESHGTSTTLTVSLGLSFYPDDGSDLDTLIKTADNNMYIAKNEGRNKTVWSFYQQGPDIELITPSGDEDK